MLYRFGRVIAATCLCLSPIPSIGDGLAGYDAVLAEVRKRTDGYYSDGQNTHPQFYPIGFSDKSEFAYALTETECFCDEHRCWHDDAIGNHERSELMPCDPTRIVGAVVVNLINDAVSGLTPEQVRTFMERNSVLDQEVVVHPFPLEHKGDRYTVTLEGHGGDWAGKSTQPPDEASLVQSIDGYLHSERLGMKRFFHLGESDEASDEWSVGRYAGFRVIGYIKSPYEDRIVIVMSYRARAQHDGVLRYVVSGAHLEHGFSSK